MNFGNGPSSSSVGYGNAGIYTTSVPNLSNLGAYVSSGSHSYGVSYGRGGVSADYSWDYNRNSSGGCNLI